MKVTYPSPDFLRSSQALPPRVDSTATTTAVPVGHVDDMALSLDIDPVPPRESVDCASQVNSEKGQDVQGTHCDDEPQTVAAETNSATIQQSAPQSVLTRNDISAPAKDLVAKGVPSGGATILAGETPPSHSLRPSPPVPTVGLNVTMNGNPPPELALSLDQTPQGRSTDSESPDTGATRLTTTPANTPMADAATQDSDAHATPPAVEIPSRPVPSSSPDVPSRPSSDPALSGASGNDQSFPKEHDNVNSGAPGASGPSNDPSSNAHTIPSANNVPADAPDDPRPSLNQPTASRSSRDDTAETSVLDDSQNVSQSRKVVNPFLLDMNAAEAGYVTDTVRFVERTAGEKESENPQLKLQDLREDIEEVVNSWAGLDRRMGYPASNVSNSCGWLCQKTANRTNRQKDTSWARKTDLSKSGGGWGVDASSNWSPRLMTSRSTASR